MRSCRKFHHVFNANLIWFGIAITCGVLSWTEVASAQATVTVLHTFTAGTDAAVPLFPLILGTDGNFYGATPLGGGAGGKQGGPGTVFKMAPDGTLTILFAFGVNSSNALQPAGSLIQATDGNFYGTTYRGGDFAQGTIYQVSSDGTTFTVLHSFNQTIDGCNPEAPLIQATDGNFYGTTYCGGAGGTIFKMTPDGTVSVLAGFSSLSPLVQGRDGNLYGQKFDGTLFQITMDGAVTEYNSVSGNNGSTGGLVQATDGNFYGTMIGVANPLGTIFRMAADGTVTALHDFNGSDGRFPYSGLIQAADGDLYGTTLEGGTFDGGTAYKLSLDGTLSVLYNFTGGTDGGGPRAALLQAPDGDFYGVAPGGGGAPCNCGLAFRLSVTNTSIGMDVDVAPIDVATRSAPATLTFSDVTQTGRTSLQIISSGPAPPSGFSLGTPPAYYYLETTALFSDTVTVCINYTGITFSGSPELFQYESGTWVDRTTSSDPTNDTICATTSSLSPFAIFSRLPAYSAGIQPPINADGSSVFKVKRGVVPIKFTLALNGASTCSLPPATIAVFRTAGGTIGLINEADYLQPSDTGSNFRIDIGNCQYIYNLGWSSLGSGSYLVQILIDKSAVGSAAFSLK